MGAQAVQFLCNSGPCRSLAMALRMARAIRCSNRLLLSMGSPSDSIYARKPVDSVTVPGTEGTFTVTNNHSLIVSQLKAGVITVRDGSDTMDFFSSTIPPTAVVVAQRIFLQLRSYPHQRWTRKRRHRSCQIFWPRRRTQSGTGLGHNLVPLL